MSAAEAGELSRVVFVHRASVEAGNRFFADRAPTATAIADPEGKLFAAFGLRRGRFLELLGPRVLLAALRALLRGNFVGRPTGNETQLAGSFVVAGREILFAHRAKHAGDHADMSTLLAASRAMARGAGRVSH